MTLNSWYSVFICILVFFSMGCDRLKVNGSKISLQVPANLSEKMTAAELPLKLKYLSVQVTAADMSEPIVYFQDSEISTSLSSEVTLEVPAGANRLVQVLAVYASVDSSQGVALFYGDVSKSLSGSAEVVDVPLGQLGGGTLAEGRLQGRYLSSAMAGPSGELKMFYRPAGKPSLIFAKTMMFGGWFDAVVFNNIPLDYRLPDGSSLGEQWTTENINLGPNLVRINKPESYWQEWSSPGAPIWKKQNPQIRFYGFFASNSLFVSDKTVCVQVKSPSGGTIYSGNDYLTMSQNNPIPFVHFPVGTTPKDDTNKMSFIGGRDASACKSLSVDDEFKSYLRYTSSAWWNRSYGAHSSTGIKGLYTYYSLPGTRYAYQNDFSVGLYEGKSFLFFRPLPGAIEGLDGYQIYTRLTPSAYQGSYESLCSSEDLKRNNWSLVQTMPLGVLDNGHIKVPLEGLLPPMGVDKIICLSKAGRPYGYALPLFSSPMTNPSNLSLRLSSVLPSISTAPSLLTEECRPIDVYLDGSIVGNPFVDLNYTIVATQGGAAAPILYDSEACTGTGLTTLTKDFLGNSVMSTFFVKSGASGPFNLAVSNNKGIIDPSPYYLMVEEPDPTVVGISIMMDLGISYGSFPIVQNIFPEGCHPIVVSFYANSRTVVNTNGTVHLSWLDGDEVTSYSPPSDVKLVNNCTSKIPIASSMPVAEGVARFAIEVGASRLSNVFLNLEGLGVSSKVEINTGPLVYKLNLSSAAHNIPSVDSCIPLNVESRDQAGNSVVVAENKKIKFYLNARGTDMSSPGPSLSYFLDNRCVDPIGELAITEGTSSTTFYIKPSIAVPFYLSYNSGHAEVFSSWNIQELFFDPLSSP